MTNEELKMKSLEIASQFVSAEIMGETLKGDKSPGYIAPEPPEKRVVTYAKKIEIQIKDFLKSL